MRRRVAIDVAFIAGLLIAGGLCGIGARLWIGGLKAQHAQLESCILSSRHSHSGEDAGTRLAHLDADVPVCMDAAGYEQAQNNAACSRGYWQGDVFCYLPKSAVGKLIYRIEAASAAKKRRDDAGATAYPSEG